MGLGFRKKVLGFREASLEPFFTSPPLRDTSRDTLLAALARRFCSVPLRLRM